MSPWKHLSVHALEQAYIRLGVDCYELLTYLASAPIEKVTKQWATENFNILTRKKQHEYYQFKDPKSRRAVLAIVEEGVVLTLLTQDIVSLNLKHITRRGNKTITKTLEGGQYEHKGF